MKHQPYQYFRLDGVTIWFGGCTSKLVFQRVKQTDKKVKLHIDVILKKLKILNSTKRAVRRFSTIKTNRPPEVKLICCSPITTFWLNSEV